MPRQQSNRGRGAPARGPAQTNAVARQDDRGGGAITQAEAGEQNLRQVVGMVAARRDQLEHLLAGQVDPERFVTVALQAVQTQPALLRCSPLSIFAAIRDAATYGLEPAGILGDAAIVPYDNVATLQIEYRGYRKLALRDGTVKVVHGDVVYEADQFRIVSGSDPRIEHEPSLADDRGPFRGVYAWARFTNGELVYTWLPAAAVLKRRDASKSYRNAERDGRNDSTWHKWFDEMALKTGVKRLCVSSLPLTPVARQAIAADTLADLPDSSVSARVIPKQADARARLLSRMGIGTPAPAGELAAGDGASGRENGAGGEDPTGQRDPAPATTAESGAGAPDSGPGAAEAEDAAEDAAEAEFAAHAAAHAAAAVGGPGLDVCGSPDPWAEPGKSWCLREPMHPANCRGADKASWDKPKGWDDRFAERGS